LDNEYVKSRSSEIRAKTHLGVQTYLHVLATDGCFYNDAAFMVCPPPDTGKLEELFRYEVFKMLKAEGKITDVVINNMMNWPPARRALEPTPRRAPQRIQRVLRQRHLAAQ
jgi:hypothetical protein